MVENLFICSIFKAYLHTYFSLMKSQIKLYFYQIGNFVFCINKKFSFRILRCTHVCCFLCQAKIFLQRNRFYGLSLDCSTLFLPLHGAAPSCKCTAGLCMSFQKCLCRWRAVSLIYSTRGRGSCFPEIQECASGPLLNGRDGTTARSISAGSSSPSGSPLTGILCVKKLVLDALRNTISSSG